MSTEPSAQADRGSVMPLLLGSVLVLSFWRKVQVFERDFGGGRWYHCLPEINKNHIPSNI
jgi:hypothetical protein